MYTCITLYFYWRNIVKLRAVRSRPELQIHAFISSQLDYWNSLFTSLSNPSYLLYTDFTLSSAASGISYLWSTLSLFYLKQGLLVVPWARLKTKGDCAFVTSTLQNALHIDLHSVSVEAFKIPIYSNWPLSYLCVFVFCLLLKFHCLLLYIVLCFFSFLFSYILLW